MPRAPLAGRGHEQDVIARPLDGVHDDGGALLVRGEADVGKSAWPSAATAIAEARGMLVLRTVGVQSEMNLSFAALHYLLRPVLGHADRLLPRSVMRSVRRSSPACPELGITDIQEKGRERAN